MCSNMCLICLYGEPRLRQKDLRAFNSERLFLNAKKDLERLCKMFKKGKNGNSFDLTNLQVTSLNHVTLLLGAFALVKAYLKYEFSMTTSAQFYISIFSLCFPRLIFSVYFSQLNFLNFKVPLN